MVRAPRGSGEQLSYAAPARIWSSTWAGCLAASTTRGQYLRTVPSGPIHTLERMMPEVRRAEHRPACRA